MTEYISREAGMELLSQPITMSMCLSVSECHNKNAQRRIDLDLIENLPAADVRENRRGKWQEDIISFDEDGSEIYAPFCSECGKVFFRETNYCPNCGADMREES